MTFCWKKGERSWEDGRKPRGDVPQKNDLIDRKNRQKNFSRGLILPRHEKRGEREEPISDDPLQKRKERALPFLCDRCRANTIWFASEKGGTEAS